MFDPRMYGQVPGMGGSFPRQNVYPQQPTGAGTQDGVPPQARGFGGGVPDRPVAGPPNRPPPGYGYVWDGFKWVRPPPPRSGEYGGGSNMGGG